MPKKGHFFKFIVVLRLHESRKATDMFNLLKGNLTKLHRKHKKDQMREDRIQHFTKLFCEKQISIKDFLEGMAGEDDSSFCSYLCFLLFLTKCSLTVNDDENDDDENDDDEDYDDEEYDDEE